MTAYAYDETAAFEVLACPRCGMTAKHKAVGASRIFKVVCKECNWEGGASDDLFKAYRQWNASVLHYFDVPFPAPEPQKPRKPPEGMDRVPYGSSQWREAELAQAKARKPPKRSRTRPKKGARARTVEEVSSKPWLVYLLHRLGDRDKTDRKGSRADADNLAELGLVFFEDNLLRLTPEGEAWLRSNAKRETTCDRVLRTHRYDHKAKRWRYHFHRCTGKARFAGRCVEHAVERDEDPKPVFWPYRLGHRPPEVKDPRRDGRKPLPLALERIALQLSPHEAARRRAAANGHAYAYTDCHPGNFEAETEIKAVWSLGADRRGGRDGNGNRRIRYPSLDAYDRAPNFWPKVI